MLRYLLRRLLIFIPTLIVISLLAFGLSKVAPGDPVEMSLRGGLGAAEGNIGNIRNRERVYQETARFLGLDKPVFYFALSPVAYPDSLYRIPQKDHRETLRKLVAQHGNWLPIAEYYQQLRDFEALLYALPNTGTLSELSLLRSTARELYLQHRDRTICAIFDTLQQRLAADSALNVLAAQSFAEVQKRYARVKSEATPGKLLIPDFKWYGLDNQYHHWFANFLRGNFGISYTDGRPVGSKIWDALYWTLLLNSISILIAYLLSIPLGVFSAVHKDTGWDRVITVLLFVLYSLPTFWVATLLLIFFTTPEYGMYFFPNPARGMGDLPDGASLGMILRERVPRLILPVFCLTYASLAFISRQMRGGMLDVLQQDYIRTARAKGLSEHRIIWKHAFRNALFPIVTLFASVLPGALAGSVVIEVIFNIPGMGKLTVDAIGARDYPVVYTVLMLGAILTMAGILIADVLYALLDPRVSYAKSKT